MLRLAAPGISASPSEDNLRYFNVMILGPQQSPYEGGYKTDINHCVTLTIKSKTRISL